MNQRGRIQFTTVLLLLGIVVGVFVAINYGPPYLDHMSVKQTTQQYLNRYTSADQRADVDLRQLYVNELNRIGEHVETDDFGKPRKVPGLGIKLEQITMSYDNVTSTAKVGVEYDRTFQLWPLKKWKTLHFAVVRETIFKKKQ